MFVEEHDDSFDDQTDADKLQDECERLDRAQQDDEPADQCDQADPEIPDPVVVVMIFQYKRFLHLHDRIDDQYKSGQYWQYRNDRLGRKDHKQADQSTWYPGKERHGRRCNALGKINKQLIDPVSEQNDPDDPCRIDQDIFVKKTKNESKNDVY